MSDTARPTGYVGSPIAPAANRLFLLILQHPQEVREARATAVLTVATLRRAQLVTGLSWPNLAKALGRPADPRRWGVLYLGSTRPAALAPDRELLVLERNGEAVADPAPVLRGLEGVVLLDGTWSQAKTLWWRNSWLLKLQRIVLNPARPSQLGVVRREPRRDALSTIEAAALLLRHVEAQSGPADALTAAFEQLLTSLRRPAQAPQSA
ncbi:MAG: DTW domain-containing protein [Alphaproteobacteria bacterium]|nr:DTW domain-containing protein [Alphaproteobacteria bacterium]